MKKRILTSVVLLVAVLMVFTVILSYGDEEDTYHTSPEIQEYLEEDMDNYFLPAAYDISPFTVRFGSYMEAPYYRDKEGKYVILNCSVFYENEVVYNEKGKVAVPPVYTLVVSKELYYSYVSPKYMAYTIHRDNNRNNVKITSEMYKALTHDYSPEGSYYFPSEYAVDAYLAPWTLNDDGTLYTWGELMEMSIDELEKLNFESLRFERFITNLKPQLEKRGWWKEEYCEKYDLLYSHKNDYRNTLEENEILTVDGEDVYLDWMYKEYSSENNGHINNIITYNIYKYDMKTAFDSMDASVKEKYSDMVTDIYNEWNFNRRDQSIKSGLKYYREGIETCAPPDLGFGSSWLSVFFDFLNAEEEYTGYRVFYGIRKLGYTPDEIRKAFEDYNFVVATDGSFNFEIIEKIISNTPKESIDYFVFETSIVMNYETGYVIPWWRAAAVHWCGGNYNHIFEGVDDFDRVIKRLEYIYDEYESGRYKRNFRDNIEYLKDYREFVDTPQTGDGSVVWVVLGVASFASMVFMMLVIRKNKGLRTLDKLN